MTQKKRPKDSNPKELGLSRREFLIDAGLITGGVLLGGSALSLAGCGGETTTVTAPGATTTVTTTTTVTGEAQQRWGREVYPLPGAAPGLGGVAIVASGAFVQTVDDKCFGCDLCARACSMKHFGVVNKDASRIQVRQPQIPILKGVAVVCAQCQEDERECEKACPTTPKSIHFDNNTGHMVVNTETCLGKGCLLCQRACNAKAVRFNEAVSDKVFVCDLCDVDNTGHSDPECVKVCPNSALIFSSPMMATRHWHRRSIMEKADMLAERISPVTKESFVYPERNW